MPVRKAGSFYASDIPDLKGYVIIVTGGMFEPPFRAQTQIRSLFACSESIDLDRQFRYRLRDHVTARSSWRPRLHRRTLSRQSAQSYR